jgi:hypothetical protein
MVVIFLKTSRSNISSDQLFRWNFLLFPSISYLQWQKSVLNGYVCPFIRPHLKTREELNGISSDVTTKSFTELRTFQNWLKYIALHEDAHAFLPDFRDKLAHNTVNICLNGKYFEPQLWIQMRCIFYNVYIFSTILIIFKLTKGKDSDSCITLCVHIITCFFFIGRCSNPGRVKNFLVSTLSIPVLGSTHPPIQ